MGYIDLHTHGIAGYDTRSTVPEDYLRMAESFALHGTGAFLPTLFPGPVDTMRAQMAAVKGAMEQQGPGARMLGVHLEGPFVNPARAGALGRESFLAPSVDSFLMLIDGFGDIVRIITVAPELPGALAVIENAAGMSIRVNMGHSDATFAQAADGRRAGATGVTHLFNAMAPMHHREPGLAGYALTDDSVHVEIIADLVHLHPETLKLVLRCKPAGRVILVSDSLGPARTDGAPPGRPLYMPDGITLAGSGITLSDAVENLVSLGVGRSVARAMASEAPAAYLGAHQNIL